jgi:hypothetical protein
MAVAIACTVMASMSAAAIVGSTSCSRDPALLNVAVSTDLAPAIQQIARVFNGEDHSVGGRCAQVQVTEEDSATAAGQIDGQQAQPGLPPVDAWIPDSSLWVDVARSYPLGAQAVQPTGLNVAESPLMLAMSASAAAATQAFAVTPGWNLLLPASVGGPPASLGLRVELPDPQQSATGLATLVEMSRLLGNSPAARASFAKFVFSAQTTTDFGNPISLAAFVASAGPPANEHPVTVTSEQAVLAYDRANPGQPLAARYPIGAVSPLGSPKLDYPFVLTTASPLELAAARMFEKALQQGYAASVIRYDGFRSADGVGDSSPRSFGLSAQPIQPAVTPTSSEAQTTLQAWQKLGVGSRDLTLIDASAAMDTPDGNGSQTLEQALTQASALGLSLFPDTTNMGLWEFSADLTGTKPYRQLVSVGPLPAELGLITRRQQLQQIIETLQPTQAPAGLYGSILAAYQQMQASYRPEFANAVLVLTAGIDNAPGDISAATLLARLRAITNPDRKVEIVAIMFGNAGNFTALQQVASATGGGAYEITDPTQILKVFFEAISQRLCNPGCSAP